MASSNGKGGGKGGRKRPDKALARQQSIDLCGFPAVYSLAKIVDAQYPRNDRGRGRKPADADVMIIHRAAFRAAGSGPEAIRQLNDADTWAQCDERYFAMIGKHLPAAPYILDRVLHYWSRALENPDLLPALETGFIRIVVAQARKQGNLLPDRIPDWTNPSERHTIYGDGTFVKPFSDVYTVVHPPPARRSWWVAAPSRWTPPGSSPTRTDAAEDGKDADGFNFIGAYTRTEVGRIVLATGYSLRAELWGCLAVLEAIAEFAADGVHTLLWDRVVTGWVVEYLMAASAG